MNLELYEPHKINIPPKSFNLQLFLTLELSQLQEILSAYSELLFFLAEYSFLFEAKTHPENSPLSTQDPARDGSNWWNYCNSNPVTFTDSNGNAVIKYMEYGLVFGGNENDKYVVRSQTYFEKTVFDKAQDEFYPIMADKIIDFQYSLSGEQRIKEGNGKFSFADMALTGISVAGDLKLTRNLEKVGKIAGWISNIKFGIGICKSYKDDICDCAIEELTCELFMYEMASDSPELSEKLYKYAKGKMNSLYKSGNLNIDYNFLGEVKNYTAKDSLDIEVIKNDLNNYKQELKYGIQNE